MTPRQKTYLTYFLFCFVPAFLLATLNYWSSVSRVESTLREQVQGQLSSLMIDFDRRIDDKELVLQKLASSNRVKSALSGDATATSELRIELASKLSESLTAISLVDANRRTVLAVSPRDTGLPKTGPKLQLSTNVLDQSSATIGALTADADLNQLIKEPAGMLERRAESGGPSSSLVILLDKSKQVLYHTDHSLEGKRTNEVLQSFDSMAQDAVANGTGVQSFDNGGRKYFVAYGPIPRRNVALAVAQEASSQLWPARLWGLAGFLIAIVAALVGAKLLEQYVAARARGLVHITEGVSAIAKGEIDRRIELRSSDDARGLADNINVVIERLRVQIAREEETRQFNSFVRLSAMLTHDLKNAIEALSLTVGNMERHFDNEQFRADAMKSLTGATDKLKGIVSRLSRPLTSMSGEFKRPMEVDLIPILNRVLAVTAEPSRGRHSIEIKLPQTLTALADPPRIEEVMENLVINALEAMGDRAGKLTIEARRADNGAAIFSVSDTGPGMSQEFINTQLFKPFSTTKRAGVGLGLYTCREVVAAHAGTIEVESVQGAGTTFRVVLPSTSHDRRK